jgi:FKBP-type peptidyl-prolyl cis-trans isomerase FkpA
MFKKVILGFFLLSMLGNCSKKNSTIADCTYDPCAVVAPAAEIQSVKSYVDSAGIPATKHCSGVYYVIDDAGTGTAPNACSTVSVTYRGALTNGSVFDEQSVPVLFQLTTLITSWRNTLPLIKSGGKIRLYIPPSLGYGSKDVKDNSGNVVIPANSILIFNINLVAVH